MEAQNDCPVILLTSGQTLKVRRVLLYEEDRVNEIALLRTQAMRGMGGVSTGIGFWGSPSWALGGAAALGLVEGILSNAARKQAIQTIQVVAEKTQMLAKSAIYFDFGQIGNAHSPHPQTWYGSSASSIDVGHLGWSEKSALLTKYDKTKRDIIDGHIQIEKRFVHDGDEFVHVETDVGRMSIRWQQHLVAYSPAHQLSIRE